MKLPVQNKTPSNPSGILANLHQKTNGGNFFFFRRGPSLGTAEMYNSQALIYSEGLMQGTWHQKNG